MSREDLQLAAAATGGRHGCAGEDPRLQLADPVPAGGERQARIGRQMLLKPLLVEPGIVEAPEARGQPAQGPDQLKLRGDPVDDETEPRLPSEVEPRLGVLLHHIERIAGGKKVRDQMGAAKGPVGEIAHLLRRVKGAAYQAAAGANGLRPGHDMVPENQVDARLEAIQPTLGREIKAELAKAERRLVIAELRAQHGADNGVGVARRVVIAMLQAKIRHAADDDAVQILVGKQSRGDDRGEDIHGSVARPGRPSAAGRAAPRSGGSRSAATSARTRAGPRPASGAPTTRRRRAAGSQGPPRRCGRSGPRS